MAKKPLMRPAFYVLNDYMYETGDKQTIIFATKEEAIEYWHQNTGKYKNSAPVEKIVFDNKRQLCDWINNSVGD